MRTQGMTSAAIHFDTLPDSACININTLQIMVGKSRATIYRWVDSGYLPRPRKPAGPTSQNAWVVGEVRRAISGARDD